METDGSRTARSAGALSKQRIVEAAIAILDTGGEGALTFRSLAARLATGSGAIYWHVANKGDLLAACADVVIDRVMIDGPDAGGDEADPAQDIRALALGVFDAIDAHPWVGAQLSREPWRSAMLRIFEGIGGRVRALGVPDHAQFHSASALVNYILGVAGQNAANARFHANAGDRTALLDTITAAWMRHDPMDFPFAHQVATQRRDHDDREQFLAGIDLILAGIATAGAAVR